MSARSVVIDTASGLIRRTISGDPTLFALQVDTGESLFALTEDDGFFIDDAHLKVSETGGWELLPGAPEDLEPPTSNLELIPA